MVQALAQAGRADALAKLLLPLPLEEACGGQGGGHAHEAENGAEAARRRNPANPAVRDTRTRLREYRTPAPTPRLETLQLHYNTTPPTPR
jgi:hypothetical protein